MIRSVILSGAKDLSRRDASPSARLSMTRSLRSAWAGSARLITGAFGAVMNGLTASDATTADRNVDMLIGGQAVIEGVLMRSLSGYSVAVRQPNGTVARPSTA